MARTDCWSHVERVLLTHEQVLDYELPAPDLTAEVKRAAASWHIPLTRSALRRRAAVRG
ncbi:hypothetical protein ACFWXO_16690 [Kitasatospora sp. NPDC059088]|uniref:hypothetical protein n=1 Tax=Kitasatospora sp. NPDC059088 TaxID=3346722 RepID=UPI00369C26E5